MGIQRTSGEGVKSARYIRGQESTPDAGRTSRAALRIGPPGRWEAGREGLAGTKTIRGTARLYDTGVSDTHPQPESAPSQPDIGWEIGVPAPQPAASRERLWRLLRRATLVGAGASLAVHLVLWLIAALVTVSFTTPDAGGSAPGAVDFAVLTSVELSTIQQDALELESPAAPELPAADAAPVELMTDASGSEAITPELTQIDTALGSGDVTSSSSFEAASSGSGAAGAGSGASFFGLEAQGRRFAYIVDRSASMNADTPSGRTRMELTQRELDRSIDGLLESAEFFVVFYSNTATPLGSRRLWSDATERKKLWARRELYRAYPDGGTQPMSGFEQVFKLRPPPDAIYFMTDGRFLASVPESIEQLNRRSRIPIHSIMFGEFSNSADRDEVERMMRRIAADSGGSFARVDGNRP